MGLIEGYYVKVRSGDIFAVKDVVQPPGKVVAYPKYVLTPSGSRICREDGARYRKVETVPELYRVLYERYGNYIVYDVFYGREVPEIPLSDVVRIYDPRVKLQELMKSPLQDSVVRDVVDFCRLLSRVTPTDSIGVSGSVLVSLHEGSSDIDVVVYGREHGFRVYGYLENLVNVSTDVRRYDEVLLKRLYISRGRETPMDFTTFVRHEERRVLEGLFRGREYFIRLIQLPSELDVRYGTYVVRKLGTCVLKAIVVDASESIFTPCRYRIKVIEFLEGSEREVCEVYSLRGRFCELASEGDTVICRGTLEEVHYVESGEVRYRVYLGDTGDYLVNLALKY
ncbi:MAG: hypothetical protein DRJ40_06835 [Thermoprotei archaeon]|nr:MAG: hypothetical protein DRJ40_06835 [Thermoprotei archaeon]